MSPERTRAVLVGVEEYAAGPDWRLDGPALDACRFAAWLLDRGVPAEQISLLVAPLERNKAELADSGLPWEDADSETVKRVFDEVVRQGAADETLIVVWGGHGVVEDDYTRRLFYRDADTANRKNLHLDGYLRALRTDYFPQYRHLLLVDACQTFAARWRGALTLPDELPPFGRQRAGVEQYALIAAGPGERALNIDSRRTGIFSEVVLKELKAMPADAWPPDWVALTAAVTKRFAELRARGLTRQTPSYLSHRTPFGEEVIAIRPPLDAAPPRRLSLAELKAISEALLEIDELLDSATRRRVLLHLPREMAVTIEAAHDTRQQVQNWVRTCARFAGGRDAFVSALEMVVPTQTPEFRRVAQTIEAHWPGG